MAVKSSLQKIFDADWNDSIITKDIIHPNLVVCPINCRDRLEALLQQASKSIVMYQQYIVDEGVQKILQKKFDE
jgi:hypothetical protein